MARAGHAGSGLAAIPALMALADATQQLRVGSRVICLDFRHPVVLANEMATIDVFSEGRLELGLGAGWLANEYEAMGIPVDPAPTRIDRLAEAVSLLKLLFGEGPVLFHGDHFHVEGVDGAPKPAQRPHPPIVIGGGGRRVLQLAGREADIVSLNFKNPSGALSPDGVQRSTEEFTVPKIEWIREGAGDRFDELQIDVGIYYTVVTDDARGVAEAMSTEIPTISYRQTLDDALRILQTKSAPAVGVVDASGRLVGLVSSETLGEMLLVGEAMPQGFRFRPWGRRAA